MPDSSKLAPVKTAVRRRLGAVPGRVSTVRRRVVAMQPVHRRRLAVAGGGLLLLLILIVLVAGGGGEDEPTDLSGDATPIAAPAFTPSAQRIGEQITVVQNQIRSLIDAGGGLRAAAATEASDGARDAEVQLADLDPPADAADEVRAVSSELNRAGQSLDALSVALSAEQSDRVERSRSRLIGIAPALERTNAALRAAVGG